MDGIGICLEFSSVHKKDASTWMAYMKRREKGGKEVERRARRMPWTDNMSESWG